MPAHEPLDAPAALRFRRLRVGLPMLRGAVVAAVLLVLFTYGVLRG